MQELINFIKSKCSQEEIQEIVNELSTKDKDETQENNIPKTWEEYCDTLTEGYIINASSNINKVCCFGLDDDKNKNVLPTREMAESFLAYMQIMSLRQAWIGDLELNWELEGASKCKFCIVFVENSPKIEIYYSCHKPLSFPTNKMAEDFLECFRPLIEQAKLLI